MLVSTAPVFADRDFVADPDYARACAEGDAAVMRLREMPPGLELGAALVEAQPLMKSNAAAAVMYAAYERQRSWLEAQQMECFAQAAAMYDFGPDEWLATEVASLTHLSEASMHNRMSQMRHVAEGLPLAWEAWAAGRITGAHIWVLGNVTRLATPALCQQVEQTVLDKAIEKRLTPSQLGDAARAAMAKLDPEGAEQRKVEAKKQRSDVRLFSDEDELARLSAIGDVLPLRHVLDEINRRADERQRAGDDRTIGEIRVDELTDAVLGPMPTLDPADEGGPVTDLDNDDDVTDDEVTDEAETETDACGECGRTSDDSGQPARRGPRRPTDHRLPRRAQVLLLMSLQTMLGGNEPAWLDGYGPITASMARRIAAADATFRRLLTDPITGKPVDLGRKSYRLSAEMRRWIDVRDRCCTFPGCTRRAVFCDIDHAIEYPLGETSCANCGLACRRHHNYKTKRGWRIQRHDDGSVDWYSPLGFKFTNPPNDYGEFTPYDEERVETSYVGDTISDDPDPPDHDALWPDEEPMPAPPQASCDCELDHDDIGRSQLAQSQLDLAS
jgi:hypothetical protein